MCVERLTKIGRLAVRMYARGDPQIETIVGLILDGMNDRDAARAAKQMGYDVNYGTVWRHRWGFARAMQRAAKFDGVRREDFIATLVDSDE